jgi:hypothetical protein
VRGSWAEGLEGSWRAAGLEGLEGLWESARTLAASASSVLLGTDPEGMAASPTVPAATLRAEATGAAESTSGGVHQRAGTTPRAPNSLRLFLLSFRRRHMRLHYKSAMPPAGLIEGRKGANRVVL